MHKARARWQAALGLGALLVGAGVTWAAQPGADETEITQPVPEKGISIGRDFSDVYADVAPSVVAVIVEAEKPVDLAEKLKHDMERTPPRPGSGFIIGEEGFVITSEDVVAQGERLSVLLSDGTTHSAQLIGKDVLLGIALIKIVVPEEDNGKQFPALMLGDSDAVRPGDWVAAIGHSTGALFDESEPLIAVGIVAGVNRSIARRPGGPLEIITRRVGLIQTDIVIEAASAGAPLVATEGKVVGVNIPGDVAAEEARGQARCNFAVPINMVERKIPMLAKGDGVVRPMKYGVIDAQLETLHEMYADVLRLEGKRGVYVKQVVEGGAAARAGMRDKDVILSVNGQRVVNVYQLINVIAHLPIGKPAAFEISRVVRDQPSTMTIDVTLNGKTIEELEAAPPQPPE